MRKSPPPQPPADAKRAAFVAPWVLLRSPPRGPFIFQRMVDAADPSARPGDVVNLYAQRGDLLGRGLYNPRSQIAVRVLADAATAVDDAFWRSRLSSAVELRRRLNLDADTDAYRLVHAEGDGLSGLIVERYADVLVFELFALGMHQRIELLSGHLRGVLGRPTRLDRPLPNDADWSVIVRADSRIEGMEGFRVATAGVSKVAPARRGGGQSTGETPVPRESGLRESMPPDAAPSERVVIREHGIRYRVDVRAGHKTGFFCDQRDNRRRFAALCRDASVLDICCYTGGFGIAARVLGAARDVIGVDLDEAAIALARENANLNQVRVDHVHADAFTYLRQMHTLGRQFDSVVLDPPKLAPTREELPDALRKYHDLNSLALRLVRPGGVLLTCSCSGLVSPDELLDAVHAAGRRMERRLQLFDRTGAGPDHPVMLDCPESAYLKAMWMRVM